VSSRVEVFAAIESERDYQESLPRNTIKSQSPMEYLALIDRISRDMNDAWYENSGQPSMEFMRKIAAVAVRAMEEHGVVNR
jgi:hypothetical protein